MYELVITIGDKEQVVYTSESEQEAELMRQRHVRSLAVGEATVRKQK